MLLLLTLITATFHSMKDDRSSTLTKELYRIDGVTPGSFDDYAPASDAAQARYSLSSR